MKLLQKEDRNLLVLGGGDGNTVNMALNKNHELYIDVVDFDHEINKSCVRHLNRGHFDNENIRLIVEDSLLYLKKCQKKYDGIVCDMTDSPIGRKKENEFENFYKEIISLGVKSLNENGWFSIQAGTPKVTNEYIDSVRILKNILTEYFVEVKQSNIYIPSFGEEGAFLYGKEILPIN